MQRGYAFGVLRTPRRRRNSRSVFSLPSPLRQDGGDAGDSACREYEGKQKEENLPHAEEPVVVSRILGAGGVEGEEGAGHEAAGLGANR